jgi:hypothetical protein
MAPLAIAQERPLADFYGVYVGVAHVLDARGGPVSERHLDLVIAPGKSDGFETTSIVVTLVDGRRDAVGVERDVVRSNFREEGDGVYLLSERGSLFAKKSTPDPIAGDALRWARIKGDTLSTLSFAIQPDGRYELQIAERTLTDTGMDLDFRRFVDGDVVRTVAGSAIRVQ